MYQGERTSGGNNRRISEVGGPVIYGEATISQGTNVSAQEVRSARSTARRDMSTLARGRRQKQNGAGSWDSWAQARMGWLMGAGRIMGWLVGAGAMGWLAWSAGKKRRSVTWAQRWVRHHGL